MSEKATPTEAKEKFNTRMKRYIDAFGLEHMNTRTVGDGFVNRLHKWHWPRANNGTKYDRTLVVEEYTDGGLSIYLDDGTTNIEESIIRLARMVHD